jgi:hypothetical protein
MAWAFASVALLPLPALANDEVMIVSPIGIGTLIVAAIIGFGIGKFTR